MIEPNEFNLPTEFRESDLPEVFCCVCGEPLAMGSRQDGICTGCDQVACPSDEEMETFEGRLRYGFRLMATSEDLG